LPIDVPKGYEVRPPVEAEVRKSVAGFEAEIQVPLPASYKAFLYVFGPGVLCGFWYIAVPPGGRMKVHERHDAARQNETFHTHFSENDEDDIYSRWMRHFLIFGDTIGGDTIAFDRSDVCESSTHEYRILFSPHGDEFKPVRVARSFTEFVYEVVLEDLLEDRMREAGWSGWSGGCCYPDPRFEPARLVRKSRK
jgi:hypothetical protein